MKRLAIIGAGHLGQQIKHHAEATGKFEVVGFYDDSLKLNDFIAGLKVLGTTADVLKARDADVFDEIIIGIGYKHLEFKHDLFLKLQSAKVPLATIIHPSAYVDPTAKVFPGTVIYPGVVIDMNATVASNVLLNCGSIVCHDSVIGESCFVAPGVKIAGFVKVHPVSFLGIGACILDNVVISQRVIVGAAATVVSSIHQAGVFYGTPAKFIRDSR